MAPKPNFRLLIRNLRTGNTSVPENSIFNLIKEQNMKEQELVERIAALMKIRYGRAVSKTAVAILLDSLSDVVTAKLKSGDEVILPNLGKLAVKHKAARTGRNPQTGESIQIQAKRVADFTAAKSLKDALA